MEESTTANPSAPQDDRSWPRRHKELRVEVADTQDLDNPFNAWVLDHSPGGLRLAVHNEFAEGKVLSVRPPNAADPKIRVQVEVKSCINRENHWELGCQFVRSPSYNVLMMFD